MPNINLFVPFYFQSPFLFVTTESFHKYPVAVGGVYAEVDTKEFKASQYNHVTDTYEKIPLSQREKEIGKRKVQRDLYSAFLIRNADLDFKHPDREKCEYEFEYFADMQEQLILKMKESGLSMRQCFGF